MKFIVYADNEECIICTPDTEQECIRDAFTRQSVIRQIENYRRIEIDGNHIYAGSFHVEGRPVIETDTSGLVCTDKQGGRRPNSLWAAITGKFS